MTEGRHALARASWVGALALAMAGPAAAQERSAETPAALARQAEADLAQGDVASAIESFERVTRMGHDADAELGLVRAYMQDGQYRRAMAFCAHVAAEHFDVPDAALLYAELLRAGGQGEIAKSVIARARERAPADRFVAAAARSFDASPPTADDDLFQPHRLAPFELPMPGQASIPSGARVASSGVLLADGDHAIVPAAALLVDGRPVGRLWVRDGLGRTREAQVDRAALAAKPAEAIVLRLRGPLAAAPDLMIVPRAPFDGSPAYVVEHAEGRSARPAWPWLRTAFFTTARGGAGRRSLGAGFDGSGQGGAVFDARGRIAGMLLRESGGQATVLPVSLWPAEAGSAVVGTPQAPRPADAVAAPPRAISADEVYEHALRVVLQVIMAP